MSATVLVSDANEYRLQLAESLGAVAVPVGRDSLVAATPDDVIGVLRRSLAAFPSDRFATARAMSAALSASLEKLDPAAA